MATLEERQKKITLVKDKLDKLAETDASSLARTNELSRDINFKTAVPFFEDMLDIVKQLQQRNASRLPTQQLDSIITGCDQLETLIKEVREFTLNQNTPGDICNKIIDKAKNAYDTVMNPLLLPLAFTATQATDYSKIEREAKGYYATIKAESEKLIAFIEQCKIAAERALNVVKEQAAKAGVSTNAQIFLQDSGEHKKLAKNWLIATIVVSAVTFIAAGAAIIASFLYQPPNIQSTIQYVASKIIFLSTLSFGIFWCAKNYKSQKHNETLNKHRANALMTFNAFVEGSSDQRVKDAILLQAAQAAFICRPTGFDSPEKDAQLISPVLDILGKTVVKTSE